MADKYNPGKVDLEEIKRSYRENGGDVHEEVKRDGTKHVTAYSRDRDHHMSWDEKPDGTIENVHSDSNGHSNWDYKSGHY